MVQFPSTDVLIVMSMTLELYNMHRIHIVDISLVARKSVSFCHWNRYGSLADFGMTVNLTGGGGGVRKQ